MLEFKTYSGNMYAWDDEIGLSIPFYPTMKAVFDEISNKEVTSNDDVGRLKGDFKNDDIHFCYNWINKWNKFKSRNGHLTNQSDRLYFDSSPSHIRDFVLRNGLLQLTLCVTEDCNFRCKYCVYSENYDYTRTHSKKYMNFITAKKAIDHYFLLLKEGEKYNPLRKPSIAYYGGEPLLNFKLIVKCVDYIKREYGGYNSDFVLTTNGSLLNKEKADWLIKNDFSIGISLDGPKEMHDRNRVYKNGRGTYDDVMRNIRTIMDFGHEKIHLQGVFDWKSDLFKLNEFFNRDDIPHLTLTNLVSNTGGSRYYDQFSKEDLTTFKRKLEWARGYCLMKLSENKKDRYLDKLFLENIARYIFGIPSLCSFNPIKPFTAACIPGRKIYVDTNGTFYMCERVSEIFSIGNINDGLNFKLISEILKDFLGHMDKCLDCGVRRACDRCYQIFEANGEFLCSSEVCKGIEESRKEALSEAFTIAEINPTMIEAIDTALLNTKKFLGDQ